MWLDWVARPARQGCRAPEVEAMGSHLPIWHPTWFKEGEPLIWEGSKPHTHPGPTPTHSLRSHTSRWQHPALAGCPSLNLSPVLKGHGLLFKAFRPETREKRHEAGRALPANPKRGLCPARAEAQCLEPSWAGHRLWSGRAQKPQAGSFSQCLT